MLPIKRFLNFIHSICTFLYPNLDIIAVLIFVIIILYLIFCFYKRYYLFMLLDDILFFNLYFLMALFTAFIFSIILPHIRTVYSIYYTFFYLQLDIIISLLFITISFFLLQNPKSRFYYLLKYFFYFGLFLNILILFYFLSLFILL